MVKRRAFTLIEFLIASSLTLLVLGSAALATASSQRVLRDSSDLASATRIATSVLDKARALGCGEDTDPRFVPTQRSTCSTLITGSTGNGIGDYTSFTTALAAETAGRATTATVEFSTAWHPRNWAPTTDGVCGPPKAIHGDSVAMRPWVNPEILERRVEVKLGKYTRTWRQLSAAPDRLQAVNASELGAVLAVVRPGEKVKITTLLGETITRIAPLSCTGNDVSIIFPYLAAGVSYDVTVLSSTGAVVVATQTRTPPSGGVVQL